MTALDTTQYSTDPFTLNYGADKIQRNLAARYGQRYHDYRADWNRAGPEWIPEFPLNLVLDLVDKCSLACPQCLRAPDLMKDYPGFIGTRKGLDADLVARLLEEAKRYRLPSVNIGGSGECTLHPEFLRICEKVMETDVCEFRIISNGLKLKDDIATGLIDLGVHMVSVSIDGFSPETFHQTRGKAHRYQDVVDNVITFAETKRRRGAEWPLLRVSFVEQACNRHETEDFVRFWSQHADMVDVQVYHDFRKEEGFLDDFDCFEPFKRMTIWAYGGAGPCCGFPGIVYNIGDFTTRTIKDIWDGEGMAQVRAMVADKEWEKPCLQCQGTRTVV